MSKRTGLAVIIVFIIALAGIANSSFADNHTLNASQNLSNLTGSLDLISQNQTLISVLDLSADSASESNSNHTGHIILLKNEFFLGELINISVREVDFTEVEIRVIFNDTVYLYLGLLEESIFFSPVSVGEYSVELWLSSFDVLLDSENFSVVRSEVPVIRFEKESFILGETVQIYVDYADFSDYSLQIDTGSNVYNFMGDSKNKVSFVPKTVGNYIVTLSSKNNAPSDLPSLAAQESFIVEKSVVTGVPGISITTDKKEYLLGETALVNVKAGQDDAYRLTVYSDSGTYRVLGVLDGTLRFNPKQEGEYTVKLERGIELLASSIFSVSRVLIEKENYNFGEIVVIRASMPRDDAYNLNIYNDEKKYEFFSVQENRIRFKPPRPGNYIVKIEKDTVPTISSKYFFVKDTPNFVPEEIISKDREEGETEEESDPVISLSSPAEFFFDMAADIEARKTVLDKIFNIRPVIEASAFIRGHEKDPKMKVILSYEGDDVFKAKFNNADASPGIYTAVLMLNINSQLVVNEKQFQWGLPGEGVVVDFDSLSIEELMNAVSFDIKNSKNDYSFSSVKSIKQADSSNVQQAGESEKKKYDVELDLSNSPVKKIHFRSLLFNESLDLGIDQISEGNLRTFAGVAPQKLLKKVYAIDPSHLNFDNATVTATATGSELYKCRDWNFESQLCEGAWIKIMDLVPGQDYEIILSPADPGYAETGVASINTKKPIYKPGESAEIIIVVLSRSGHLVNDAEVNLSITTPYNQTADYSTRYNEIIQTSRGIYEAEYNLTSAEGEYSLFVQTYGSTVDTSMSSYFLVKAYYEFDILRTSPVTTDPWQGPFNSSIKVISYTNSTSFDFVEVLPINFTLNNDGGAEVETQTNTQTLTWAGLSNNSEVTYLATPPLVTPDLYVLGPSYVEYSSKSFVEARPWYLAIDPTVFSDDFNRADSETVGGSWTEGGTQWDITSNRAHADDCGSADTITSSTFNISGVASASLTFDWEYVNVDPSECINLDVNNGSGWVTDVWTACSSGQNADLAGSEVIDLTTHGLTETFQIRFECINNHQNDEIYIDNVYVTTPSLENNDPNVTLVSPSDNGWMAVRNVNFTYFPITDDTFANCSLWTNETGWSLKETVSSGMANNSINGMNDTFASDGDFLWNIECYDNTGNSNFSQVNYTVRVDTANPTLSLIYPGVDAHNDTSNPISVNFNCSLYDAGQVKNLSFYLTNNQNTSFTFNDSCTITGLNSSCAWTRSLPNGNYTWNCLGYDMTNHSDWGINRTIKINASYQAPSINAIQCQEQGAGWEDCSNLVFNETLLAVRVNCTDSDSPVENASFNFTNIPDGYNYFFSNASYTSSDWFVFNNTDFVINESGEFNLDVVCYDNMSLSNSGIAEWTVPWGTIVASLVSPSSDINVDRHEFFTFTAQVSCSGGECGNVDALLDPQDHFSANSDSLSTALNDTYTVSDSGDYSLTSSADCSGGTCTSSNSWVAGIIDMDNQEPYTGEINATLTFNVSSISTSYINNVSLVWSGCWGGEESAAVNHCANTANPEFKIASVGGNFTMLIYNGSGYEQFSCINNINNECVSDQIKLGTSSVAPAWGDSDAYNIFKFQQSAFDSKYVNNGLVQILWRVYGVSSWGETNSLDDVNMIIDYANLTLDWDYPEKTGAVSTIIGDQPFYTTDANPQNYSHESCLESMTKDDTCQMSWQVNATGGVSTIHEFFVQFNMSNNQAYVNDSETAHIDITIIDLSTSPPNVTLNAPVNNNITNTSTVIFNCSATDTSGLSNMTLYGNFEGSFAENGTNVISGLSDTTTFTRTLPDGVFTWNCQAYDADGIEDWGDSNRTITVDTDKPAISLEAPLPNETFYVSYIDFNFTVIENVDSSPTCNITINADVKDPEFTPNNGSTTTRTITDLIQGTYYWNVSCWDDALNLNFSETRNFSIVDLGPTVYLITANNTAQQSTTIDLQYNATDNNNVTSAQLYINAIPNATNVSVIDNQINTFRVEGLPEGKYNWTVNVSDLSNLTDQADEKTFVIDFTAPDINVTWPPNPHSISSSTSWFNFTATDNLDDVMKCNITYISSVVAENFDADNASQIEQQVTGLPDGVNSWYITCSDDAGNNKNSTARSLNVSAPPSVALSSPASGHWQNDTTINLFYVPTDNSVFSSCNLVINGVENQSNASFVTNGATNNFTLPNLAAGHYNWTVNCTDGIGLSTTASPERNFSIDLGYPSISLNEPTPNQTIYSSLISFNFTAIDDWDGLLSCNLTLDDSLNETAIPAVNSSYGEVNVTVGTEGLHNWSISCSDDGGNTNTSLTRYFLNYIPPEVSLNYPGPDEYLDDGMYLPFNYYAYDSGNLANSTLIINNVLNKTDPAPVNGENNTITINITKDGIYTWTVNVTDLTGVTGTATQRTFTLDTTAPNIAVTTPYQDENVTWNNVTFNFTATDNLDSNMDCNVTVDSTLEWESISAPNATPVLRYKVLADGLHNWSVFCTDHLTYESNTGFINFTVDAPPIVNLNFPIDNYRNTSRDILFNYTPEDAIGFENCTILIDGVETKNDSDVEPNVPNYFNVTGLDDGTYNWTVYCVDENDLNPYTAPEENFTIDNAGPVITLIYPGPGATINDNNLTFNWTATDFPSTYINCSIRVNDTGSERTGYDYELTGSVFSIKFNNLSEGLHFWNVTCTDDLGNINLTESANFTINQPDLVITSGNISFNNTSPTQGRNITINATIFNIGGILANNFIVQFFAGNPSDGGTQIGANQSVPVLINGDNTTVAVNWTAILGTTEIWVVVDPDDSVAELLENNNNASKSITTSTWQILYGNATGKLLIKDDSNLTVFEWDPAEIVKGNLYVTDKESSITWSSLEAIGKMTNGSEADDDFEEIDIALNTTSYSDSVNSTYTFNRSNIQNATFIVFTNTISDVPTANSSTNSTFVTGILWDSSDSGGVEYNGTEDLIFVGNMSQNTVSTYGTYDYEIRFPSELKRYKTDDLNSVALYLEIK